ncbi:MAG: 30S ribosomal protein S2 [Patescibacteria group bacterium]
MADKSVDIKALLEAGAHFGHKTSHWHPAMKPYIHGRRGDNYVIDLTETVKALETALKFIEETVAGGQQILLVSTKRQARDIVKATALKLNMPYVTERWLGGMLTNQNTTSERIKHLVDLENKMASGELANKYNKLEVQRYQEEIDAMNIKFGGIKEMPKLPGVVFIVDVQEDMNAVMEARKLKIATVALVDTNVDPRLITYPVPSNDDAIKTIQIMCDYVAGAVERGVAKRKAPVVEVKAV